MPPGQSAFTQNLGEAFHFSRLAVITWIQQREISGF